jgi:hypothetical protein
MAGSDQPLDRDGDPPRIDCRSGGELADRASPLTEQKHAPIHRRPVNGINELRIELSPKNSATEHRDARSCE